MKPDASSHNPDPRYLRGLVDKAGVSQRQAAELLGLSWPGFRNYLRDESHQLYRAAPTRFSSRWSAWLKAPAPDQ